MVALRLVLAVISRAARPAGGFELAYPKRLAAIEADAAGYVGVDSKHPLYLPKLAGVFH